MHDHTYVHREIALTKVAGVMTKGKRSRDGERAGCCRRDVATKAAGRSCVRRCTPITPRRMTTIGCDGWSLGQNHYSNSPDI